MSSKYSNAEVVESTQLMVYLRMPDGNEFWVPKAKYDASFAESVADESEVSEPKPKDSRRRVSERRSSRACKVEGCGVSVNVRRGWCSKHYQQWYKTRTNNDAAPAEEHVADEQAVPTQSSEVVI